MQRIKKLLASAILVLGTWTTISAQSDTPQIPVTWYLGGSYTVAPSYDIGGRWTINTKTSGNFYSLFTDLEINQRLIGRAQVSFLSTSSLGDDLSSELESGFEMNGSLGYRFSFTEAPKISVPLMATIGFATVSDERRRDAGMQLGGTLGLNYALSERLEASGTLRILRGVEFSDGSKISQTDFSIGIRCRLI